MSSTKKYFLVSTNNGTYECGTLIEFDGNFRDLDENKKIKLHGKIPESWIELLPDEMKFLLKLPISDRILNIDHLQILNSGKDDLHKRQSRIFQNRNMDSFIIDNCLSGLSVIDPKKIFSTTKHDGEAMLDKILIFNGTKYTGHLKWKGTVNEKYYCIGCEMVEESDYGCNGIVNEIQLFKCSDKRGYFIHLTDCLKTCVNGKHNAIELTSNIINEACICCIEKKKLDHWGCCKSESVILKDGFKGTLMWQGLINGEESIGVELTTNPRFIGYKSDGLIGQIKLFSFDERKGALYPVKGIPTLVSCDEIKADIVNPTNIDTYGHWTLKNKKIAIKHAKHEKCFILNLKGKVKVNDLFCLGIELDMDCPNGTNGTFIGHTLFKCNYKRGILLPADDLKECCEKDNKHKSIELSKKKFIDQKCICCAETLIKHADETYIKLERTYFLQNDLIGECKWIGTINEEKCIGLEMRGNVSGTDGTFNGFNLFTCESKRGVLFQIKDIPKTFSCDEINDKILNPTTISSIMPLNAIEKYLLKDRTTVKLVHEYKVDGGKCFGCILTKNFKYGTSGRFNDMDFFKCEDKRGVIISIDGNFKGCLSNNQHNELKSKNYINEDSICCISCNLKETKPVEKVVAVDIDNKIQFAKLMWTGDINGKESVGVELFNHPLSAKSPEICKKLFEFEKGKGFLYQTINTEYELKYVKDIYLRNVYDMSTMPLTEVDVKLIVVQDDPLLYGRSSSQVVINSVTLILVEIDPASVKKREDLFNCIIFQYNKSKKKGIYVKMNRTAEFCEQLTYIGKSLLIDMKSVKIKEEKARTIFKTGDIVSYPGEHELCFGKIHEYCLLNDIPCLGIVNSIELMENKEIIYIREDCARKHDVKMSLDNYHGGVILKPDCIAELKKSRDEYFHIDDDMEFRLIDGKETYRGRIILPVEANGVQSVVVELYEQSSGPIDLRVNETCNFSRLCHSVDNNVFVVASFAVKVLPKSTLKTRLSLIKEYCSNRSNADLLKIQHDNLKTVYNNISNSSENVTTIFAEYDFFEFLFQITQVFKVKDIQRKSRLERELQIILDCTMTHLSIVCYMCDEDATFRQMVLANEKFMNTLKVLFEELQIQSEPLSIEDQLIENILFIYWNVVRFGGKLSYDLTNQFTISFQKSDTSPQIKLVSALLLSFMKCPGQELLLSIKSYLIDLSKNISEGDIRGFPRNEILSAIGNICVHEPICTTTVSADSFPHLSEGETMQEELSE